MGCCGGGCECYEEGYEQGADDAIIEIGDEERGEMAQVMWHEVEKTLKTYLQPIEDKAVLKEDPAAQVHVAIVHDILVRLRPIFD